MKNNHSKKSKYDIIGVYPLFNTGGIAVHAINTDSDKVLVSMQGGVENPVKHWVKLTYTDDDAEFEFMGNHVKLSEVQKV